jgi:hypothetical protein
MDHQKTDWHRLEPESVFDRLQTSPQGLTAAEAMLRLKRFGFNKLRATIPTLNYGEKLALIFFNRYIIKDSRLKSKKLTKSPESEYGSHKLLQYISYIIAAFLFFRIKAHAENYYYRG